MKSIFILLMTVFFVSCTTAPKSDVLPPDYQDIFNQAEATLNESHSDRVELAKAMDLYGRVLSVAPRHVPSIIGYAKISKSLGYLRGIAEYDSRFVKHGLQFVDAALKIDPHSALALAAKAHSYAVLKDFDQAREWLEKAEDQDAKNLSVLKVKTIYLVLQKSYSQALETADQGYELSTDAGDKKDFTFYKSEVFARQGDLASMITSRMKEVEITGNDHWSFNNLAGAYLYAKDWEKCVEWAEKALNVVNFPMGRLNYWHCSIQQGKFDQALEMKWKAKGKEKVMRTLVAEMDFRKRFEPILGSAPEIELKKFYELVAEREKESIDDESYETGQKYHAIAFYITKTSQNFAESLKWLDKGLQLNPKNFPMIDDRVRTTMYGLQDKKTALKYIDEALSIKTGISPANRSKLLKYKSEIYGAKKDYEKGAEAAKQAVMEDPSNEMAYSNFYGMVMDRLKQPEKIVSFHEEADADTKFNTPEYLQWKAYYAIAQEKDNRKAEKILQASLALNPKYSMAYYRLAFIHQSEGKSDIAIEEITKAVDLDLPFKFIARAKMLKAQLCFDQGKNKKDADLMREAVRAYGEVLEKDPKNSTVEESYLLAKRELASILGK